MGMTKEAWAKIPPERRRDRWEKGLRTRAVETITEQWHLLTDEQREQVENVVLYGPDAA